MKSRLFELLEHEPPLSQRARVVRIVILALILISVLGIILESVASIRLAAGRALFIVEVITIAIFTVEYLTRLWTITEDPRFAHPVKGRLRWMVTPYAILDLLAIVPFYLPFVVADLRILRLARIFRLFRVLKIARYSVAIQMMGDAAREKREELLITVAIILVLLLLSSSLIYYAENHAQPDIYSSIPAAMWWSIVTLTTVGYGDTYPITAWGRLLASLTALFGIAMLALPTAILSAGFMERMQEKNQKRHDARDDAQAHTPAQCPHCGKNLRETQQ